MNHEQKKIYFCEKGCGYKTIGNKVLEKNCFSSRCDLQISKEKFIVIFVKKTLARKKPWEDTQNPEKTEKEKTTNESLWSSGKKKKKIN